MKLTMAQVLTYAQHAILHAQIVQETPLPARYVLQVFIFMEQHVQTLAQQTILQAIYQVQEYVTSAQPIVFN